MLLLMFNMHLIWVSDARIIKPAQGNIVEVQ